MYATTFNPYNAASGGILSGQLSSNLPPVPPSQSAPEPADGVVVSGYSDASAANAGAYFAQSVSGAGGTWALPTSSLPAGTHTITITANYGAPIGTTTIATPGPGGNPAAGGVRIDQQVNGATRT